MILSVFILIISVLISGITLYFTGLYVHWYFDLIGVILIPVIFLLVFGIILLILFIIGLMIDTKKEDIKPNKLCMHIAYQVTYVLTLIVAKVKFIGKEKLPKERFLLVYNHRSNWDPMVLMKEINNKDVYYITKPGNMKIPVAGPFIKRAGYISLNRENNKEGLKAIIKAINIISSDKGSIGIAPEGTRNKTLEKELLDFHPGSFKIALKAKCPIVVCTVKNCEKIKKNFPFKRTRVYIEIIQVIPYDEFKDLDTTTISNEVYNLMEKNLKGE